MGSIIKRCRQCGNRISASCKHTNVHYSIVYSVGKKSKWEAVKGNKKDAERLLTERQAQVYQGTYRELKPTLFRDFSEKWLRDYAEGAVKPLTLRSYRGLIRTHLNPAFGSLALTQITPDRVVSFMSVCRQQKGLSPKTVNHLLTVLKTMLSHAEEWGLLRKNPAQKIRNYRVESKEMAYLEPDEIRLLVESADEPYRTLFLTAVLTGMRQGELLGLQWGDIDWHHQAIRVHRSLYWQSKEELASGNGSQKPSWRFSTPKSSQSIRTIVMSPKLKEALELHRLTCPVSPDDLVFCTPNGGPIDANNMVKREFFPALSGAELRKIRFHDLRHTYTALLIAQGAHAKFIQSQLGHASIQTTLDRYGHLLPGVQHGVGERLDAVVFGSTNPEKAAKEIPVAAMSETLPLS